MSELVLNMSVPHLIIPIICTGALFISLCLFLYFYFRFGDKIYLIMILTAFFSLVFVGSDLVITVFGELLNRVQIGLQFHRIEQLGGAFFLFCLPLILVNLMTLNKRWQKINKIITITGLGFAVIILFSAFIFPDSFISQTTLQKTGHNITWHISRGQEGILYIVRDILLGILIIYSFACVIFEMIRNKNYKRVIFILIGIIVALLAGVDDTFYVHTGYYIGIFSNFFYSRFSVGITLFTICIMSGVINRFIDEVKNVDTAYKEKNNAYRTLGKSNERFKQLAENINEVFLIYDYDNEVFLYISPAYENIWGNSHMTLFESPHIWQDMVLAEDKEAVLSSIGDGRIQDSYDIEYRITCPDNSVKWIRDRGFPVRDDEGEAYRMVRTQEDISDRKKSEERLIYLAYYDVLTGLLNRRSFFERLNDVIGQSVREENVIKAILLIDLTKFKTINNTFGNEFGDKILKIISDRLTSCLRETDYIFRIAGNEFAVILKNISMDIDASIVASKILSEISMPYNYDGRELFINCSIGISIYPKDSEDAEALVKNAYLALNEAKKERNTYRFFDNEMNVRALERLSIENNLRYAASKNEFSVNYQPFVNIEGKITGMEALIRWNNPVIGLVPPEKFITIAESTGQIIAVGEWVLRTACNQIKKWHALGYNDLRIAVNISAVQLMDNKFVERVETVLKETNLDPRYLELEITESSVMKNPEDAVIKINQLYDMGVFLSIDDFGVDHSSLNYIKRFKINRLKIDRSFTMDIILDKITAEIIKAVIGMAHNLSIKVIAEGIETIEQKEFMKLLKCDEMQGYIYSRPLPADDFERLLKNNAFVYPSGKNAAQIM
jgi:diguanylate cyclase (GGDEF)-like protein/PAS domain S-box-containing protein